MLNMLDDQLELCKSRKGARTLEKKTGKSLKELRKKYPSSSSPAFDHRRVNSFAPVGRLAKTVTEIPSSVGVLAGVAAAVPQALGWVNRAGRAVGAVFA